MGIEDLIQLVKQGDPVSPSITNAPTRALDQKIRYLWDLLQAASTGSTVYARAVTVEAEAAVGMPVYYNNTTQRFERGLALAETVAVTGALLTAESAKVWGLVANKTNSTLADVLLYGYETLSIAAATNGSNAAGTWYLSGQTRGGLVQQRPPVSVAVLRSDGTGRVFVMPQFVDFLERHVHYKFALACAPAGAVTPPVPGERHAISVPDTGAKGWLPAFDPVFGGKAPSGAAFGYNLAADPALDSIWPPVPLENAYLEWDKGIDPDVSGTGVPLGSGGLCVLNRDGIWWMSDCYGDVPWPVDTDTANPESVSLSDSHIECPRLLTMTLTLWFTRINFATDTTAVTSLRSLSDRLIVRCLDGDEATMGDLTIDLDLDLVVADNARGYLALKSLEDDTFQRGPVCEGIYALSDTVSLTGPLTTPLDPDAPGGTQLYHGPVGIAVAPASTQELLIETIRVDRVETETYQDTTYLGFRAAQASSFRAKLAIPAAIALPSPQLALRFLLLGRALGSMPSLTVTARRLPRPTNGAVVPVDLPLAGAEFAVTIDTAATLSANNQYIEATSTPFAVAAGDVIFFTVSRAVDGYPAEIGLIQQIGILSSGS